MDNTCRRTTMARTTTLGAIFALIAIPSLQAQAQPQPQPTRVRGKDLKIGSDFFSALTEHRGVEWKGLPLHVAVEQLTNDLKLAIFLDRRIDPTTPIDVSVENQPVYGLLDQVAKSAKLDIAVIEYVVYLAPAGQGDQIGARAKRLGKQRLPVGWKGRHPLDWARLGSPREQLEKQLLQHRIRLVNSAAIPHDLWRATHLPSMPLSLQTQIIAAGFGLEVNVGKDQARLDPEKAIEPRYSERHTVPATFAWDEERLVKILGGGQLEKRSKDVTLVGTSWQQAKLAAALRQRPQADATAPGTVVQYTVPKTRGPLVKIIPALAKRLMLQVQLSDKIEQKELDQVVEFSVTNATRKQLLDAIFADTDLNNRVVDGNWIIEPR